MGKKPLRLEDLKIGEFYWIIHLNDEDITLVRYAARRDQLIKLEDFYTKEIIKYNYWDWSKTTSEPAPDLWVLFEQIIVKKKATNYEMKEARLMKLAERL